MPAPKSLPAGQSAEGSTTNLAEVEIPKEPTGSSSQDQLTAEHPSKDHAVESLSITTPTADALSSSRKLPDFCFLDVPAVDSDQEPSEGVSSNQSNSDTIKEAFQHTNHKTDGQKLKAANTRKRVRIPCNPIEMPNDVPVICIDSSDDDNDFVEILPFSPTHDHLKRKASSSSEPFKSVSARYNDEWVSPKRRKHATNLPAPTIPDSPEGSTKSSEDEPNNRRKTPRNRVTVRELNDYVDIEKGWLDPSLSRCHKISQLVATQNLLMASLETLNNEIYTKLGYISAHSVPRKARLDLGKELKDLERKRRGLIAELGHAVCDVTIEAASMGQNLEQWHAQESKFTKRIERSR